MAILQALISLLTRSAGKVLNAIFGWAVTALFGQPSPREQTLLSALVGAAAAWPLLALGVAFPRLALFVIAFVPMIGRVPPFWLRIVWIVLALAVPIVVGLVVAARSGGERLPEPKWKKFLRGFPITIALAAAFLTMLVVAPIQKIISILKRQQLEHVPAVMDRATCREAMEALAAALVAHGIPMAPSEAPWHMVIASRILLKLGGKAFTNMVSERIEFRRAPELEVAVLPNETVLLGKPDVVARAHALTAEVYGPRPVVQTFSPVARELERQIKRVWQVLEERHDQHVHARALGMRVDEIAGQLAESNLPWDEWQSVYRLLLQLDRALHGGRPLLNQPSKEDSIMEKKEVIALPGPAGVRALPADIAVQTLSNKDLLKDVVDSTLQLAKKEIELAKAELRQDLKGEIAMAKGLGVAGLCALCTVNMMLVAAALALGNVVAEWAAALIVAAGVLAIGTVAGVVGWGKRVKEPLEATRRTLQEDARWVKERLA